MPNVRVFDSIGNPGNATATVNVINVPAPRVGTVQVNGSGNAINTGKIYSADFVCGQQRRVAGTLMLVEYVTEAALQCVKGFP